MTFVLGLTGGIGSGKTAASNHFESLGITVVDADIVSRLIVAPGKPALQKIADAFGYTIIQQDGTLDRRALREVVFTDPTALKTLEAITHPAIALEIRRQLEASNSAYSILVSPLLLETSQKQMVQRVLLIDAPMETQLKRTQERDQVSEGQVKAIIGTQMPREQKQALADDIVLNDGNLDCLIKKLNILHEQYMAMAQQQ